MIRARRCTHPLTYFCPDEFTAVPACLTRQVYTFLQNFWKRHCGAGLSDECWQKSGPWRRENENLESEKSPLLPHPTPPQRQAPRSDQNISIMFSFHEAPDLILTHEVDCLHSIIVILKLFFFSFIASVS